MKFSELLRGFKEKKTRVIINELGTGETRGLITDVQEDFIVYELCDARTEKHSKAEKIKKEVKYIPISSIYEVSEGEKEVTNAQNLAAFAPGSK